MRLKARFVLPFAVIVMVAAGTMAVSANSAEHGASAIGARAGLGGHVGRPLATSPVLDPPVSPVVDPPVSPVVDPPASPVLDPPASPVLDPPASPVVDPPNTFVPVPAADTVYVQRPNPVSVPKAGVAGSVGPAPVNLGTADTFAILTKTGMTDVYASSIKGDVGASPITGAAIGLTCPELMGKIYTVDGGASLPCRVANAPFLTGAVRDEENAYTDAAGRTNPGFVNLGAGQIGGLRLTPGLYKWTGAVSISRTVTLAGGPNDVWILQIAGTLCQAAGTKVILTGGAQAKNVFWQSAGAVTIGTTAHFAGTILAKTSIAMNTLASTNGRLLSQTAVTLQMNTVTRPLA